MAGLDDRQPKPAGIQGTGGSIAAPPAAEPSTIVNAVGYFLFSGEQHGFRKADNIQRCLDAELMFYAVEVFKVGLTF